MTILAETILRRLQDQAPFDGAEEARSALRAALAALRSGMLDDEARALAEDIDAPWAEPLRRGCYQGELPLEEFYRLAAFHEERRLSIAAEHAQIVCRVLSGLVADATRQRLRRHLPQLAELFDASSFGGPGSGTSVPRAEHLRSTPELEHTLAAGRPGSRRPLSEARPTSSHPLSEAQPDRAHTHSVARSDDPHADTKLSSTSGLTQEREGESLSRSKRSVPR